MNGASGLRPNTGGGHVGSGEGGGVEKVDVVPTAVEVSNPTSNVENC